jgi:patatin-like phospholipase/acyl hydrolase
MIKGARKRILSLDGGGIRGVIAIEVLAQIESQLRAHYGKPDLVLSDYFDLVAGTSTGAIIATAISLGWSVEKIQHFYLGQGKEMFDHSHWWEVLRHRYSGERLKDMLKAEFGDATLASADLKTLLLLVMRNVSTDEPWITSNNPNCRFNQLDRSDCQLHLPLWKLVRASTAAPSFFPPETIQVGAHAFVFVDGSISAYTNPAFFAFLRAVAKPYDICWEPGEDKILVVSVGTGTAPHKRADFKAEDYGLVQAATTVPTSLILSSVVEQDTLCRIFGNCLSGPQIDKEVGDLVGIETPGGKHLFTYVRYNEELSAAGFARMGISGIALEDVMPIDSTEHVEDLRTIGRKIAAQVQIAHLVEAEVPLPA